MDPDTGAKGKSRFDLSDVMTILDGGESAKVDEAVEEPQPEAKTPEVKISIVALPDAKVPAVRAPEAVKAVESQNTMAKANNALSSKLLADMEQKNAEILKLKSDFMSLQYKLNEKDYQLKEKDMNIQGMSAKLSDTQKKFETQQRQNNDLQRQHDDLQRQLEGQQRQNADLQKQLESQQRLHDELQKQYDAVKAELDSINEDKARVVARAEAHKQKKGEGLAVEEAPAAPAEDDVASIFKRLTQDKPEEPSAEAPQQGGVPGTDRPQPPRKLKTAKLYDL